MKGKSVIAELKSSSERVGQLYPILVDYHGNIIDGGHRYGADKGWRTTRLDHSARGIGKLLDPPEDALTIKTYANTDFVNIVVKKPLYEQVEEKAKRLETTPDKLIYNAILLMLTKDSLF